MLQIPIYRAVRNQPKLKQSVSKQRKHTHGLGGKLRSQHRCGAATQRQAPVAHAELLGKTDGGRFSGGSGVFWRVWNA